MKTAMSLLTLTLLLGGGQADLKRMEGGWKAYILEAGGKSTASEDQSKVNIQLAVQGDRFAIYFGDKLANQGVIRVDSSKRPGWIDAYPSEGPHKGLLQPGVYEFVGNDLKVVFAEPGQARPQQLKTRPGSSEVLILYRKIGK